jgi:hypothetical protein
MALSTDCDFQVECCDLLWEFYRKCQILWPVIHLWPFRETPSCCLLHLFLHHWLSFSCLSFSVNILVLCTGNHGAPSDHCWEWSGSYHLKFWLPLQPMLIKMYTFLHPSHIVCPYSVMLHMACFLTIQCQHFTGFVSKTLCTWIFLFAIHYLEHPDCFC